MITIYSADNAGRLFTDEKKHFFVDGELLREKATACRIAYTLDRIAILLGYKSFSDLETHTRCAGVTRSVLLAWIYSGTIADKLRHI